MTNFLLFKQVFCLILIFETLVLWPKFYRYFGPPAFPKSLFTTWNRIHLFNLLLLASLLSLFLNFHPLAASVFVLIGMRYLYVTDSANRSFTAGAVGHLCFFTAAYIFFFECAKMIDPSGQLVHFLHQVLAIEIGIIMISAGVYKYLLGFSEGTGFEYALVNPSWSKLFFLFNKLPPSSWIFKANNLLALIGEFASGLFFLIPHTRTIGAYLLFAVFSYVFLTVRVAILPFIMMCLAILYLPPISFHFPEAFTSPRPIQAPQGIIPLIEAVFILYLAVYIAVTIYRWIRLKNQLPLPGILNRPVELFMNLRPFFEWGVFTAGLTNFFIKIEKADKTTGEIRSTVYDGFSKHFREMFDEPRTFTRFIHHHESSIMLNIFMPISLPEGEEKKRYLDIFLKRMSSYGRTFLTPAEIADTMIVYTIVYIEKTPDRFLYSPLYSYFVDVENDRIADTRVYKNLKEMK